MRVKPFDVAIPENDPFQFDLLGRREPIEILTQLIGSIEGPAVLSVDAAWGNGKTTFLQMWAQHLRNQEFPIVEFNAWESDFCGDPFLALSERITNGLEGHSPSVKQNILKTKEVAKQILRHTVPAVIRVGTAGILDIGPVFEKEIGQALASVAKDRLAAYEEAKQSIADFRESLQGMADGLWKEYRPLVVMIDELDRCRPSYAVEFLEVAKHLFSADRIVFILAVNRSELAHSVNALYGEGFDAQGYLSRFFDIDFRLPEPDRKMFLVNLTTAVNINSYFERTWDKRASGERPYAQNLLESFFSVSDLSLRRVAQAIHHLGLVLNSLGNNEHSFAIWVVVASILRALVPDQYHRFRRGEVSDHEMADTVFRCPGIRNLRTTEVGALFEAVIVLSAVQISGAGTHVRQWTSNLSELWKNYEKLQNKVARDDAIALQEREYATNVIGNINGLLQREIGFLQSAERIELLSPALLQ